MLTREGRGGTSGGEKVNWTENRDGGTRRETTEIWVSGRDKRDEM